LLFQYGHDPDYNLRKIVRHCMIIELRITEVKPQAICVNLIHDRTRFVTRLLCLLMQLIDASFEMFFFNAEALKKPYAR